MASVQDGLDSQVRNIEARYGKSMAAWSAIIADSGKTKHTEVIAMLKAEHGLSHGDANRVGLVVRDRAADAAGGGSSQRSDADWTADLYAGKKAAMRPVHEGLMHAVEALGPDVEYARKKGYLSLRRKKQFAMIQPALAWVEVGLIVKEPRGSARLRPAARTDAMFGHSVRLASPADVDDEFKAWLAAAYAQAG